MSERDKKTDFIEGVIDSVGGVIHSIVDETKSLGTKIVTGFLAWFDKIFEMPVSETVNSILVGISPEVFQKAEELANEIGGLNNPIDAIGLLSDETTVEKLESLADQIIPFLEVGGDS